MIIAAIILIAIVIFLGTIWALSEISFASEMREVQARHAVCNVNPRYESSGPTINIRKGNHV